MNCGRTFFLRRAFRCHGPRTQGLLKGCSTPILSSIATSLTRDNSVQQRTSIALATLTVLTLGGAQQALAQAPSFHVPGTTNPSALISTGLVFAAGEPLSVSATGIVQWTNPGSMDGPDGQFQAFFQSMWLPSAARSSLIGSIDGVLFKLGSRYLGSAPAAGELLPGINDDYYGDNLGSFDVTVERIREVPGRSGLGSGALPLVPTGIQLSSGQALAVTASGLVNWTSSGGSFDGPDGQHNAYFASMWLPTAERSSLIGSVGGVIFKLGSCFEGLSPGTGELLLGINDDIYSDNQGSFQVRIGIGPGPHTYGRAKPNSLGCTSVMSWIGSPSVSGPDDFVVQVSSVMNNQSGIFFWGQQPNSLTISAGWLSCGGALVRTPVQTSGGSASGTDCSGSYSFHFSQSYMAAQGLIPGDTVFGQFWSRDPGFSLPFNSNLSQGLEFAICQ